MPKIKTRKGKISYTPIPIYEGIKLVNKEVVFDNLLVLRKVMDEVHINFQLAYGTLLGACREHDIIDHDEDIDLAFLEEDRLNFFDTLPELIDRGFRIARWDRRGCMSIIRNGEYLDLYFFKKVSEKVRGCSGNLMPSVFLEESSYMDFKGHQFLAPKDWKGFLEFEYGKKWNIPVVYQNFNKSKFVRFVLVTISLIKEYLPDCLYFPIIKYKERNFQKKYDLKIENYFNISKEL